jgi:hypothetical protein
MPRDSLLTAVFYGVAQEKRSTLEVGIAVESEEAEPARRKSDMFQQKNEESNVDSYAASELDACSGTILHYRQGGNDPRPSADHVAGW